MTSSGDNLPKFEKYHALAGTPKILTPHLINHWPDIVADAFDANFKRGNDGEFAIPEALQQIETLPEVTSHILRQSDLLSWRRAERTLEQLGFTSQCFEYYRSGGEAMIFTIKGVPDLLLKVSQQNPQWKPTNFVVNPIGRFVIQPGSDNNGESSASDDITPISIAFVPLIAGTYPDQMNIGKRCNSPKGVINIPLHVQQTVLNDIQLADMPTPFRISLEKMDGLLAHEELSFFDMKPPNVICVPNHPELPLICDPRAVRQTADSTSRISKDDYAKINERYTNLQKAITDSVMRAVDARYGQAFGATPCDATLVIAGLGPLTEEMPDKEGLEFIMKIARLSKKSMGINTPAASAPLPPFP